MVVMVFNGVVDVSGDGGGGGGGGGGNGSV